MSEALAAGDAFRIPGSVSNLGPGFDALSVAVQVYLHVRVTAIDPDTHDTITTTFQGPAPGGDNRIELEVTQRDGYQPALLGEVQLQFAEGAAQNADSH